MFVENPDPTALRQGDIVTEVPFPLARLDRKLPFLGTIKDGSGENVRLDAITEQIGKSYYLVGQVHTVSSFCAVLNQCCDVDPKQAPPPPSFLLCRVISVPEGLRRSEHFEALKANVDPYGTAKAHYRLFYLGILPGLDDEFIADYGLCMTVAWRDYNQVLKRKIAEMVDLTRSMFRVKAGAYFGRPTAEEVDAGIANPYRIPPK